MTTCNARDFTTALAFVDRLRERRSTIPILSRVLVRYEAGRIALEATDLDATMRIEIDANTAAEGAFLASPQVVLRAIRGAGTLHISRDGDITELSADGIEIRLRDICDVTDWPTMDMPESSPEIVLTEGEMHRALGTVMHAISTEETRYYLNGVFFDADGGKLRLVATDGHRMAIYDTSAEYTGPSLILPRVSARILHARLRRDGNAAVRMLFGSNRVAFIGDGWSLITKVIDGTYPDYRRVLPSKPVTVHATIALAALRRLPALQRSTALLIDPSAGRMSVTDIGDGISASAPCEGEGGRIGFELGKLIASAAGHDVIRIETAGGGEPARIIVEDPRATMIVMPMRVPGVAA